MGPRMVLKLKIATAQPPFTRGPSEYRSKFEKGISASRLEPDLRDAPAPSIGPNTQALSRGTLHIASGPTLQHPKRNIERPHPHVHCDRGRWNESNPLEGRAAGRSSQRHICRSSRHWRHVRGAQNCRRRGSVNCGPAARTASTYGIAAGSLEGGGIEIPAPARTASSVGVEKNSATKILWSGTELKDGRHFNPYLTLPRCSIFARSFKTRV
jgi:hypothetical protein